MRVTYSNQQRQTKGIWNIIIDKWRSKGSEKSFSELPEKLAKFGSVLSEPRGSEIVTGKMDRTPPPSLPKFFAGSFSPPFNYIT